MTIDTEFAATWESGAIYVDISRNSRIFYKTVIVKSWTIEIILGRSQYGATDFSRYAYDTPPALGIIQIPFESFEDAERLIWQIVVTCFYGFKQSRCVEYFHRDLISFHSFFALKEYF